MIDLGLKVLQGLQCFHLLMVRSFEVSEYLVIRLSQMNDVKIEERKMKKKYDKVVTLRKVLRKLQMNCI